MTLQWSVRETRSVNQFHPCVSHGGCQVNGPKVAKFLDCQITTNFWIRGWLIFGCNLWIIDLYLTSQHWKRIHEPFLGVNLLRREGNSQIGDRMLAVISCPNTSYVFKDLAGPFFSFLEFSVIYWIRNNFPFLCYLYILILETDSFPGVNSQAFGKDVSWKCLALNFWCITVHIIWAVISGFYSSGISLANMWLVDRS